MHCPIVFNDHAQRHISLHLKILNTYQPFASMLHHCYSIDNDDYDYDNDITSTNQL